MMDEGKILELLAEYLRKTDRLIEKWDKHDLLFDKQFKRLDIAYQVLVTHSEKIEELQRESKELRLQTKELQQQTLNIQQETKNIKLQTKESKEELKAFMMESQEEMKPSGRMVKRN